MCRLHGSMKTTILHNLINHNTNSQDFQSVFGHHIKTYAQNFNIIGSLVGNLSRLQAWPVS